MKTNEHLLIILLSVFSALFLLLSLVFLRFRFRSRKSRSSQPVDPVYEQSQDNGGGSVFVGKWGIHPVAGVGVNGSRTYLNGWFGLDSPAAGAGWKRAGSEADNASNASSRTGRRGSHWSTTSRTASRKSRGKSTEADEEGGVDDMGIPLDEKHVEGKGKAVREGTENEESGEEEEEGMIIRR